MVDANLLGLLLFCVVHLSAQFRRCRRLYLSVCTLKTRKAPTVWLAFSTNADGINKKIELWGDID